MCLAVPGRIVLIDGPRATLEVSGVQLLARVDLLPEAQVGNWVLVHAGFAITVIDETAASEIIRLREQVSQHG